VTAWTRTGDALAHAFEALLTATPEQLQELARVVGSAGVSAEEAFAALAEVGLTEQNTEKGQP